MSKRTVVAPTLLRKYYMGVGAVVSRLHGSHGATMSRKCDVVTYQSEAKVDFDQGPYLTIDMSTCFDNIQVQPFDFAKIDGVGWKYDTASRSRVNIKPGDARDAGCHSTSLGLEWPDGRFAGQLYLESNFFSDNIGSIIHGTHVWPPRQAGADSWAAQYVQMRRNDDKRFVGFSATLDGDPDPQLNLQVSVWHPYLQKPISVSLPWSTIDYDKDPFLAGFSIDPMVSTATKKGQRVSLFVDMDYVIEPPRWNSVFMTPKIPFWMD